MSDRKSVALDLETIRDDTMVKFLPDVKPPGKELTKEVKADGRIKDPVKKEANFLEKQKTQKAKIAKYYTDKKQDQIDKMGLDPMFNIICLAGLCDGKKSTQIIIEASPDDNPEDILKAEKKLIYNTWDALSEYDHFVTFNGRSFDIRVMLIHGITHSIRPGINIDRGRYNRAGSNHTDMRNILSGDDMFAKGKLDFYCKKFLGDGKMEGIDGAKVQEFWDFGLIGDIAKYNLDEIEKMYQIFEKLVVAGLVE